MLMSKARIRKILRSFCFITTVFSVRSDIVMVEPNRIRAIGSMDALHKFLPCPVLASHNSEFPPRDY